MRRASVLVTAGVLALSGCRTSDSLTIELQEVGGSGVSGELELAAVGELQTRLTVVRLDGGPITGARVMAMSPCPDIDDKYPIRPPTGVVNREFEYFRSAAARGELTAAFLRNGRYVACGRA
jgi:hypothetical protein